jgi:hypothetical protein
MHLISRFSPAQNMGGHYEPGLKRTIQRLQCMHQLHVLIFAGWFSSVGNVELLIVFL